MSIGGILIYCLRAASFAALVCGLYALVCLVLRRRLNPRRLLALAYLAALVQITVIRGGVDWARVAAGGRAAPQLVPLTTTLGELRGGWWRFVYHVVGNLIWFAPLGWMLKRRDGWTALVAGALVSVGIELMQYLLTTGMCDVDDVILNALGAWLGWLSARLCMRMRKNKTT